MQLANSCCVLVESSSCGGKRWESFADSLLHVVFWCFGLFWNYKLSRHAHCIGWWP